MNLALTRPLLRARARSWEQRAAAACILALVAATTTLVVHDQLSAQGRRIGDRVALAGLVGVLSTGLVGLLLVRAGSLPSPVRRPSALPPAPRRVARARPPEGEPVRVMNKLTRTLAPKTIARAAVAKPITQPVVLRHAPALSPELQQAIGICWIRVCELPAGYRRRKRT